ncbi:MAG: DNA-directed RNA polymerase subunit F [bacterium]|nr:DNA-directed RNA polymerase subunit F [bacterium]
MKKLSEKYISVHEVKELVDQYIKERGEPKILEQALTQKYCEVFAVLSKEQAEQLKQELKQAVPRAPEKIIVKIIDILPEKYEQLYQITKEEAIEFTEEEAKKILEILSKYRS